MGFAIAGVVATIIAAGISTYASYQQAEAQQSAAKTERKLREQEAQSASEAAAFAEAQSRRRSRLLQGKQFAMLAAAGIDPTEGSPLLAEMDTVRQGELEALNIRTQGARAASASTFEAQLAKSRASYYGGQKGYAIAGGVAGATSSILSVWSSSKTSTTRGLSTTNINPNYGGNI
jgi:hypothetical protein